MSDYLRRLPIGQRVSTAPLTGNDLWPFDADLETVALEEPRIPEPPRGGVGGVDCSSAGGRPTSTSGRTSIGRWASPPSHRACRSWPY